MSYFRFLLSITAAIAAMITTTMMPIAYNASAGTASAEVCELGCGDWVTIAEGVLVCPGVGVAESPDINLASPKQYMFQSGAPMYRFPL